MLAWLFQPHCSWSYRLFDSLNPNPKPESGGAVILPYVLLSCIPLKFCRVWSFLGFIHFPLSFSQSEQKSPLGKESDVH